MEKPFGFDIKHQVFIAVPPEKVYDTITSGDGWNAFFTHSTTIDPVPGGEMWFNWKDWGPNSYSTKSECKVVKADKPTVFAFQWYPVGKENPTTITFNLEAKHGGTVIKLTEEGYPDTPEGREMILECASGWGEALALLKFYLEFGKVYTQPKKEGEF